MRKMSRQFLSVLLAAVMILSHVQISAAAGNDTASGPPAAASGNEAAETRNLEMEPMDPAKLGIKKLGEETEEAEAAKPYFEGICDLNGEPVEGESETYDPCAA